jgi:hypothetical protein
MAFLSVDTRRNYHLNITIRYPVTESMKTAHKYNFRYLLKVVLQNAVEYVSFQFGSVVGKDHIA